MDSKRVYVWTKAYRPFRIGGDVNRPIATEAAVAGDPIDLGYGVEVAPVESPQGVTFYVETLSGGLMGCCLDSIRDDVQTCGDEDFLYEQRTQQKAVGEKAEPMSEEEFWSLVKQPRA